jgi:hypothetical protein
MWTGFMAASPVSHAETPNRRISCASASGPFPKFTGAGSAWSSSGKELLLLDNFDRTVLRYSASGRSKGPILTSLAEHLRGGRPRSIATTDGQTFYLQVDANRFAIVDSRYSYKSVAAGKSSTDDIVRKVYNYGLTTSSVLAFVDVENTSKNTWNPGFIQFPRESLQDFTWLEKGVSYEEKLWYQLAMPFITGIGDTAYLLRMTSPYALYRYDPASDRSLKKLSVLDPTRTSGAKNILPQLPELSRPADLIAIMETIEHAEDLPVGIYAYGNRLYVLIRTWRGNHTEWSLKVIDPKNNRLLGTVRLAVEADHLSLVPGPSTWALIRKSRPEGIRRQDVIGITLFDGKSLLRGDNLPTQVCGP